jgi:hypothetical protein
MADFKILQLIFGWLEYFSYLLLEVERNTILYVYFSSCEKESCSTRVEQLLFCIITYGGGVVDELGLGNSVGYFRCYFCQIKHVHIMCACKG